MVSTCGNKLKRVLSEMYQNAERRVYLSVVLTNLDHVTG